MTTYQNGFSALADPTRRAIFERLSRRPSPVGELAQGLPVSRPAVSQHLKVLRDAGLVTDSRDGSRRLYRVDPDGVAGMREYLDGFWSDALVVNPWSAVAGTSAPTTAASVTGASCARWTVPPAS